MRATGAQIKRLQEPSCLYWGAALGSSSLRLCPKPILPLWAVNKRPQVVALYGKSEPSSLSSSSTCHAHHNSFGPGVLFHSISFFFFHVKLAEQKMSPQQVKEDNPLDKEEERCLHRQWHIFTDLLTLSCWEWHRSLRVCACACVCRVHRWKLWSIPSGREQQVELMAPLPQLNAITVTYTPKQLPETFYLAHIWLLFFFLYQFCIYYILRVSHTSTFAFINSYA